MGRPSTGHLTTLECARINLTDLKRDGLIVNGQDKMSKLSWNTSEAITALASLSGENKYLRLAYAITVEDKRTEYDYKIEITTIPSSLGKGEILYFVCPETGKRCKVLYRAYGCNIWKSRQAYSLPIYYPTQVKPKWQYYLDKRNELTETAKELSESMLYSNKNGRRTRKQVRLDQLEQRIAHHDRKFKENIPKTVLADIGLDYI